MEEKLHNINGDGPNDNKANNPFHNYNNKKGTLTIPNRTMI